MYVMYTSKNRTQTRIKGDWCPVSKRELADAVKYLISKTTLVNRPVLTSVSEHANLLQETLKHWVLISTGPMLCVLFSYVSHWMCQLTIGYILLYFCFQCSVLLCFSFLSTIFRSVFVFIVLFVTGLFLVPYLGFLLLCSFLASPFLRYLFYRI